MFAAGYPLCTEKMESTELTSSVTVEQYRAFKKDKERDKISDLILERFWKDIQIHLETTIQNMASA